MGQAICLPQCAVACPDTVLPTPLFTPMRARALPQCTVAYPNAALPTPLPTPMRARALPQCAVAYPDAALPTPDAGYGRPGLFCSRPPQVLRVPVADGAYCPGGCETR